MNKLKRKKEVQTQIKNSELVRKKHLQIATGASKLFIKKGYFQTSIREISKATGLTMGNLYDYITEKGDVLYLVFDVFHSMWVNRLREEGVFEIEDPADQLKTALEKMFELVNEHRDMVLLMYTESKSLPKNFLKIILEKESGLVECFEKILRKGVEKGVFKIKDPFLSANIVVYLLSIYPLRGWNLRKHYKVDEINNRIIEFIKEFVCRNVIISTKDQAQKGREL
jgi:AcrR family transcriptional regulator